MFLGLFFFIRQGWKQDKRYILWNILYQLVNAPLPVVAALLPKLIIDELMGAKDVAKILTYTALFTGYTLIATALSAYFFNDGFTRRCRVAAEFDSELHRRLCMCDYGNLENPKFLEMQEKAKKLLYCNWHGFGYLLDCALQITGYLVTLLGIGAILATLELWVVLLFALLAALGAVTEALVRKKFKRLDDALIADQRQWSYYAGLFDKVEYGKEIRIYQAGQWLLSKERAFFTRANANLKKQNGEYTKSGLLISVFTFLQQLAGYVYLIHQVLAESISIGDFTMYVSAITVFASTFRQILSAIVEIRAYDMYFRDLDRYLSVPAVLRSGKALPAVDGARNITFKHVSFRYPGSERYALKDINLTLRPGQKLLVVGENGAGKTTFVNLLLRLYDPTEGEILLNGVNIKTFAYDSYLQMFSAVFQNYQLFSFSLRDNVAMSASPDDEKVERLLRQVGLGRLLERLENGIHTSVHKNPDGTGFEPSGGEGQKIAIARALYKDAPIVILDEPTEELDPRAEYEMYQHFSELVKGKSAVYISHRLSSAKFCDAIAVFENGRIVENGTHNQLLRLGGKYAALFRTQADFYV